MTPTAQQARRSQNPGSQSRAPLFAKLRPGPGRPSAEVIASQRARLQGAMVELAAERGYEAVTVRGLSRLAGVSTRTFYKHFANAEECFTSTYDSLMRCALRRASSAQAEAGGGAAGLRAALGSVMQDIAGHPKEAQLALVESFAAGLDMQERMRTAIAGFELLLITAIAATNGHVAPPRQLVRGIAGGAMRVARTTLLAGKGAELPAFVDELGDWMLAFHSEHAVSLITARPFTASNGQLERRRSERPPGAARLGAIGDERVRILTAAAKLGASEGYASLTVTKIRTEAGVSRRSFDSRFADAEDCFLEAIEMLAASAASRAEQSAAGAESWASGVFRAVFALCTEAARSQVLARLAFTDIFASGRAGLLRRERLVSQDTQRLQRALPREQRPTRLVAEASVGAAWHIAQCEMVSGRAKKLQQIAPLLTYVILAPMIGPAAAIETIHADQTLVVASGALSVGYQCGSQR